MRIAPLTLTLLTLAAIGFGASADSTRGAQVLRQKNCLLCHSVNGQGGSAAPDLSRSLGQSYTPAAFTASITPSVKNSTTLQLIPSNASD